VIHKNFYAGKPGEKITQGAMVVLLERFVVDAGVYMPGTDLEVTEVTAAGDVVLQDPQGNFLRVPHARREHLIAVWWPPKKT